jgi:polyisoprenoid-binding protein YceI
VRKKNAGVAKVLRGPRNFFNKRTFGRFFKRTTTNMNQISRFLFPTLLAGLSLFACQNDAPANKPEANAAPKPDTIRYEPAPTEGAAPYQVSSGTVYWSAKRAIGSMHNGVIAISGGDLMVNQGQLVGGRITLDMSSIEVTNMDDPSEKATLESHLKDKDFFEVKKYPEATFEVTEILPSSQSAFNWVIRGNLTIKDKTHPVNIPVRMSIAEGKLLAESVTFVINRTKWGVNFRSGILGTAKDKLIEDVVSLSLKIEAVKK